MLIGIDASRAVRAHGTGTEYYAAEIIRHLLRLPAANQHQWRLYVDAGDISDVAVEPFRATILDPGESRAFLSQRLKIPHPLPDPSVEIRALPRRRMWTHRSLRRDVLAHPPDVLFVPAHVIPFALPAHRLPPSVVTIHDVGYYYFPNAHGRRQRAYLQASTLWSTTAAARVIAVSSATAADLRHYCKTPHQKIRTVHEAPPALPAANQQGCAREEKASLRKQFGLVNAYALYVGTIQPRKNLARLLRSYARARTHHALEWDLVLAGKPGWLSDPIFATARALGLDAHIHFLGYVDEAWKDVLLRNALFFCFPSLFEGFGLPVLEAQQRGIPVMTSNNSALPEIAGDAALLIDPLDEEAMTQAMLRLSRDEALRQQLIEAGYQNVKRFSWEKAAQETLAVLTEAARSRT